MGPHYRTSVLIVKWLYTKLFLFCHCNRYFFLFSFLFSGTPFICCDFPIHWTATAVSLLEVCTVAIGCVNFDIIDIFCIFFTNICRIICIIRIWKYFHNDDHSCNWNWRFTYIILCWFSNFHISELVLLVTNNYQ